MVSLPIPAYGLPYAEIQVTPTQTYADLMHELGTDVLKNAWVDGVKHALLALELAEAHFDPDLDPGGRARLPGWRPMFGQVGAAQSHLRKQGVTTGDIFLFFGRFRSTRTVSEGSGRIKWAGRKDTAVHAIWGWLEIGEVITVDEGRPAPPWAMDFPHFKHKRFRVAQGNTVYVATELLSLQPSLPGGGVFQRYREELRLSAPGGLVQWELSPALDDMTFSHVRRVAPGVPRSKWNSSGQWQEAVGTLTPAATDWLAEIFRVEATVRPVNSGKEMGLASFG